MRNHFACSECDYSVQSTEAFKVHIVKHMGENISKISFILLYWKNKCFYCIECGHASEHLLVYNILLCLILYMWFMVFVCTECDYAGPYMILNEKHVNQHTGESICILYVMIHTKHMTMHIGTECNSSYVSILFFNLLPFIVDCSECHYIDQCITVKLLDMMGRMIRHIYHVQF